MSTPQFWWVRALLDPAIYAVRNETRRMQKQLIMIIDADMTQYVAQFWNRFVYVTPQEILRDWTSSMRRKKRIWPAK